MPMYEFACANGHEFECITSAGVETTDCMCGSQAIRTHEPVRIAVKTGGVGRRSSGEPLTRGEQYLASLHYGAAVKDSAAPGGRRPPRTEGELSAVLAKAGHRRGTTTEFNEQLNTVRRAHAEEEKAATAVPAPISEKEIAEHTPSQKTMERMKKRREWFRSKYDAGEIPQKEVPADVKPFVPTGTTGA